MTAQYKVTKFEPSIDGQLAVEWSRERNAVVYKTGLFQASGIS